jgi:hypothetical protein
MTTHISSSSSSAAGIGFLGALQILFLGLKLTGAIQWSWWVVMSPLLFQAALAAICISILIAVAIIASVGK